MRTCAVLVLFVCQTNLNTLWAPNRLLDREIPEMTASVPTEPIARIQIGELPVVLEETPLTSVQAAFGGAVGHRGDASESLDWLCYHHAQGEWILWLLSGEIHGDDIGGFLVRESRPDVAMDKRCSRVDASLQVPHDIRIGTSRDAFVAAIGTPSAERGDALFYLHEHRGATLPDGRVDLEFITISSLVAIFSGGRLTAVEVWRTTTK